MKPLAYQTNVNVGVRNHVVIYSTDRLCWSVARAIASGVEGTLVFGHPYGRGQVGEDKSVSRLMESKLLTHVNVAGVVLVGLEEYDLLDVKQRMEGITQVEMIPIYKLGGASNAIREGMECAARLRARSTQVPRVPVPLNCITVGVVCEEIGSFADCYGLSPHELIQSLSQTGMNISFTDGNGQNFTSQSLQQRDLFPKGYAHRVNSGTRLVAEGCQVLLSFGQTLTSICPIVPVISVAAMNQFPVDFVWGSLYGCNHNTDQLLDKILSVCSGELTFSEIVPTGPVWVERIDQSI
ncbi:UxaA family hydrolase [Alicyclobacillus tolerans]|uniref:UxaA family hydrolase n=1 Tax=Alicyclobacillus tolerans TaxID=90970 RepID=UPI001F2EA4CF|nr:UxaA family hydrolase [Alicyclobacillus tolerans]MCF8568470.1 UxaA family hydrolase [Alicyclobacillus tolerans]